jgi:hypothetical protein
MSAGEMTLDPLFTFNADLPDVSNRHTARQVIECSSEFFEFEAPWRIELPQGGVVRGQGSDRTWPDEFATLPANQRILRRRASGEGIVLEDNSSEIETSLASYNDALPVPVPGQGTAGGSGNPGSGNPGSGNPASGDLKSSGGSCTFAPASGDAGTLSAVLLAGWLAATTLRRRRHRQSPR